MITIFLCLAIVAGCIKPLGTYMARVYMYEHIWTEKPISVLERGIYKCCGIKPQEEMGWREYALAIVALGAFGFFALYVLFSMQHYLPLNPQGFAGLSPDLAFNAAISFITNTNWQSYSGESSLSYLSQSAGCAVQNFLSAATGMAVAAALFRSLARKQTDKIGNAYADVIRSILYILLPLSLIFSIFLASQGIVQTLEPYIEYEPLEKWTDEALKTPIAVGPVASQVAIKMLGSNGGGFFNANAAHPLENPTPLSNVLQLISILLIPAAFAYTFGVMAGDRRQGWMLLISMTLIFIPLCFVAVMAEQQPNLHINANIVDTSPGNMEGKETRFGIASSAFWAAATTATSNGSVNAMHDSFMPLGGLVPLLLMQLGEVIYGGVGSGAYTILVFVLLTVFVAGLMVGRTPEFLGKKLGVFEIKMASLIILIPTMLALVGTAIAVSVEAGRAGVLNVGAQSFSEILYAFSSAANNNGSAFAGLSANTPFYNTMLGVCMFIGRYWLIIPVLAIAGALAGKNTIPVSAGTLPTHTPLFSFMLIGVIVILSVLTYVPVLALGPLAEHLHMLNTLGGGQ